MKHLPVAALLLLAGCGGEKAGPGAATEDPAQTGQASGAAGAASVETATWPSDPCSWIPVADVEAVLGPLAGTPHPAEGGCLYPVPLNEETAKQRETARKLWQLAEELAKREGTRVDSTLTRPIPDPAFIVQVSVDVNNTGERALRTVETIAAMWLEKDSVGNSRAPDAEWDYSQSPIAFGLPGFLGRVGQLTITVLPQATSFSRTQIEALAAAVRDKVPDRPFAPRSPHQYSGGPPSGPDPCSLLTTAEAEVVLGPLVLPPYRTAEMTQHPDPGGNTCVYRTARHRVFRLKPVWAGGESELELVRGVGGLLGKVMPGVSAEAADTIEGPWEEAAWDNSTGDLLFRVGDRALQVSFGSSSTDAKGALRLVPAALGRLRSAR